VSALSTKGTLTRDFGFVEFHNTAGRVRAARAVAVGRDGGRRERPEGYGQRSQALLLDVDARDLIAMKLTNTTSNQVF
jgi:hypothetical protein